MTRSLFVLFTGLFILQTAVLESRAFAEETVCAAIVPCFDNGEIYPEFNTQDSCGERYRLICANIRASLLSDDLVSCQAENLKYRAGEAKLSKKIRALRKALRSSK